MVHADSWPFAEPAASIVTSTADCVAILGMMSLGDHDTTTHHGGTDTVDEGDG